MIGAILRFGKEEHGKFLLRFGLKEDYGTGKKNFINKPMLSKKGLDEFRDFHT